MKKIKCLQARVKLRNCDSSHREPRMMSSVSSSEWVSALCSACRRSQPPAARSCMTHAQHSLSLRQHAFTHKEFPDADFQQTHSCFITCSITVALIKKPVSCFHRHHHKQAPDMKTVSKGTEVSNSDVVICGIYKHQQTVNGGHCDRSCFCCMS